MGVPRERAAKEDGWDGYGGLPTSEAAIKTAEQIQYTPTSDGGLCVELRAGGAEVTIDINEYGDVMSVSYERVDRGRAA